MTRIVSIWLPDWPIERLACQMRRQGQNSNISSRQRSGRRSDKGAGLSRPFTLVAQTARGLIITAANEPARREGLFAGMALSDARAICPGLQSAPARLQDDRAALLKLALWCGRYGPARHIDGCGPGAPDTGRTGADGRGGDSRHGGPDDGYDDWGIWIDITGVAHLFGRGDTDSNRTAHTGSNTSSSNDSDSDSDHGHDHGAERALLDDLAHRLRGFGLTARIGLADTPGAAHALARFAAIPAGTAGQNIAIAAPGETRAALADLPVAALRLDASSVLLLNRLGLKKIGQLYGLPRASLERRFRDGQARPARRSRISGCTTTTRAKHAKEDAARASRAVIWRLDQALGLVGEPRRALSEPPRFIARRAFPDLLISSDGLLNEIERLCDALMDQLAAAGLGTRHLELSLYRADGSCRRIDVETALPCRSTSHVMTLLREKVARFDAGFGVDLLLWQARRTRKLETVQTSAHLCGRHANTHADPAAREQLARLVDRLEGRIDKAQLFCLTAMPSHIPERAQSRLPPLAAANGTAPEPTQQRPCLLLPRPELIEVIAPLPEGPPAQFTWRRLSRRIVRARGPERISTEWWRHLPGADDTAGTANNEAATAAAMTRLSARPVRDYYELEDRRGGRYWVFRLWPGQIETGQSITAHTPRWYLHGLFA